MMKTLITMMLAAAISAGIVRAADQETVPEKAADAVEDAAETAKDTAKQAGRTVARTTKKAVNAVADALTPEPDARQVKVKLTEYAISMPTQLKTGKTAFIVYNAGKKAHSFEVNGNGIDKKFITSVDPGKTKVLHVVLKSGSYKVYCPLDGHEKKGMAQTLTVG